MMMRPQSLPSCTYALLLTLLLAVSGCDSAAVTDDGGSPPDDGAIPLLDAGFEVDGGTQDAGVADAGVDAGPDGGPALGPHSMISILLPAGTVSFPAQLASGEGVVVTTGFGTSAGEIYFVADDQLHRLDPTTRTLDDGIPLYNSERTATHTPSLMFSGEISGSELFAAVEGDRLMLFEFAPEDEGAPRFGASATLTQRDEPASTPDRAYAPVAMTIARYGTSNVLVGLSDARTHLTVEVTPGTFIYFPIIAIETCADSTPLVADFMTMAVPQAGASAGEPALTIVSGSRVYATEPGVFCFGAGTDLETETGTLIESPAAVFGVNFDGSSDGSEEVLVVVEDGQ